MDRFKNRARSQRMRQTSAEAVLWRELRNRRLSRWKFRRQHAIDRFVVDFVTLDGKLIVGVEGETHSAESAKASDAERTEILESLGFRVIRVSNTNVYENLDGVLEHLLAELTVAGQ